MNGYLKHWYVDIGAVVKAGQVLYQIDPAPYQAALEQADAALANARAAASRSAGVDSDDGSGTDPSIETTWEGLVPQDTCGLSRRASTETERSKEAPGSVDRVRQ